MATTIQLLHSLTPGNRPGDLSPGEIAYNVADGYVYLGNGSNAFTDTLGTVIGTPSAPGFGWQQAIYNSSAIDGSVILAGTYNATTNQVISVTAAGTTAGFSVGALPAAASGNSSYYVLVVEGGTLTPPAPTGDAEAGDWLVSTGTAWVLVDKSSNTLLAQNVIVTPTGWITGPNMQQVLNQIVLNAITTAGGSVSFLNVDGNLQVDGNSTLGNGAGDTTNIVGTLTVTGDSSFSGPIVTNSHITAASYISAGGNLTVAGNSLFGLNDTNTATFNSKVVAQSNLTVNGTLTAPATVNLGVTKVNAGLDVNGNVDIYGSGIFAVRQKDAYFMNDVYLGDGTPDSVYVRGRLFVTKEATFSGGPVNFATGQVVNFNGVNNLSSSTNYNGVPLSTVACPIGSIITYAGTGTVEGYLLCDGSMVSRTTYAALFDKIGTTWGVGNGSTTFNVPDLRGMFLRGTGIHGTPVTSIGQNPVGPTVGQVQADNFRRHNHSLTTNTLDYAANYRKERAVLALNTGQQGTDAKMSAGNMNPSPEGGGEAIGLTPAIVIGLDETRPVSAGVTYLIKF